GLRSALFRGVDEALRVVEDTALTGVLALAVVPGRGAPLVIAAGADRQRQRERAGGDECLPHVGLPLCICSCLGIGRARAPVRFPWTGDRGDSGVCVLTHPVRVRRSTTHSRDRLVADLVGGWRFDLDLVAPVGE